MKKIILFVISLGFTCFYSCEKTKDRPENNKLSYSVWEIPMYRGIGGSACAAYKNTIIIAGHNLYELADSGYSMKILNDNGRFLGLSVVSDSIIIVTGVNGRVYRTTNNGSDWIDISPGTSKNITDCHFFDIKTGIIVGNNSKIMKTTDGGMTWQNLSFSLDTRIEDMIFINDSTGFIGCGGTNYYDEYGDLYFRTWEEGFIEKTIDGGKTWHGKLYTDYIVYSIDFPSEQIGYAVTIEGDVYKSTDNGESWFNILSRDSNTYGYKSVKFLNDTVGFIAGIEWQRNACSSGAIILKTTDGGETWAVDFRKCLEEETFEDMAFNGDKGLAITYNYVMRYNTYYYYEGSTKNTSDTASFY